MSKLVLVKPIENIDNVDESLVLGVIHHLMPMLSSWRKGEDLRQELAVAQTLTPAAKKVLDSAQATQSAAATAHKSAAERVFTGSARATLIAAAVIGGIAAWQVGWFVGAIVATALGIWAMLIAQKAAKAIKTALGISLAKADTQLAWADTYYRDNLHKIQALQEDIKTRELGFPDIQVSPVEFLLQTADVSGHAVLIDLSQSHSDVQLKAVDVSAMEEGLSHITDKVNTLLSVPPLLTPQEHAHSDDPVHELFGEENDLQQLVSQFTLSMGKLRDVNLTLPLVPKDSILMERATQASLPDADKGVQLRMTSNLDSIAIEQFVEQANNNRERGHALFAELNEVFSNLDRVCHLYSQARVTSVNTLHNNLLGVLNSASWCGRRFYCPRTIQEPQYVEDLLGIRASKAYLLSLDDLFTRLHSDSEINKRLQTKPELEETLAQSYQEVQEFMDGVSFDAEGRRLDQGKRPKHIESQFDEAIQRFTHVLQKIMTGSAYPVLNFSAESQLYYDPDNQEWTSNVSPYVYSSADAMKYGSVVKAYSDLMIPLWEHLWTEKADFRKSELFRTNEEMRRMTEKESEKLIDIANQFRADMRAVRENVHLLESDLHSKYSEILSFRDSMSALGLMSDRAAEAVSDAKLQKFIMGDSALSVAERYETMLGTMPQAQAENRGAVHDPIDIIREPDALLPQPAGYSARLLA